MKNNIRKNRSLLVCSLLIITASFLHSCGSGAEEEKAPEEKTNSNIIEVRRDQFTGAGMELRQMQRREFNQTVRANGLIEVPPESKASVSPYFGGYVKRLDLLPGQEVNRGQVLFVLENPEYIEIQREYLEAKGQLKYLQSDYERQQNLVQDNVASRKNFLKAESEYKVVSATYESLRKKLRLMHIDPDAVNEKNLRSTIMVMAPISGYVTTVNANIGRYLDPSDVAVELIDPEHLHLEIRIFERDLPKVRAGQEIIFKLQDDPGTKYEAEVYLVGKSIEPERRTISVHADLINEDEKELFNAGMYVEAEIFTSADWLPSLPEEAVISIDDLHYVLMEIESNEERIIFKKKEVKTGPSRNGYTAISNADNFNKDTRFLTQGAFNLIKD